MTHTSGTCSAKVCSRCSRRVPGPQAVALFFLLEWITVPNSVSHSRHRNLNGGRTRLREIVAEPTTTYSKSWRRFFYLLPVPRVSSRRSLSSTMAPDRSCLIAALNRFILQPNPTVIVSRCAVAVQCHACRTTLRLVSSHSTIMSLSLTIAEVFVYYAKALQTHRVSQRSMSMSLGSASNTL